MSSKLVRGPDPDRGQSPANFRIVINILQLSLRTTNIHIDWIGVLRDLETVQGRLPTDEEIDEAKQRWATLCEERQWFVISNENESEAAARRIANTWTVQNQNAFFGVSLEDYNFLNTVLRNAGVLPDPILPHLLMTLDHKSEVVARERKRQVLKQKGWCQRKGGVPPPPTFPPATQTQGGNPVTGGGSGPVASQAGPGSAAWRGLAGASRARGTSAPPNIALQNSTHTSRDQGSQTITAAAITTGMGNMSIAATSSGPAPQPGAAQAGPQRQVPPGNIEDAYRRAIGVARDERQEISRRLQQARETGQDPTELEGLLNTRTAELDKLEADYAAFIDGVGHLRRFDKRPNLP
ncbi:hypothetical protein F4821DRAFT_251007 [Hypoxylon rubiginosum]|uniref:Uncharacterized protein n=1 Tax=Hypoxylon rubiginosum TaxID=110542 RepID=A0ACC0CJQ8_9PEZI|nr:hypothetical protein F4821DRAFT_251007 [Hypoxylon rubiginosum]